MQRGGQFDAEAEAHRRHVHTVEDKRPRLLCQRTQGLAGEGALGGAEFERGRFIIRVNDNLGLAERACQNGVERQSALAQRICVRVQFDAVAELKPSVTER